MKSYRHLLMVGVAISILGSVKPALAQTQPATEAAPDEDPQLADIIVTAERRSTDVQRTPMAITVLGGDDLVQKGIVSSKNLVSAVPGFAFTAVSPNSNLSLRGVGGGGGSAYSDPTVSFNNGGVNIARQFSTQAAFFDLDRVEILKGPQGTLYGRNATVGAINLVPKLPAFKDEASIGIDVGNYDNIELTGVLNAALSSSIAARVAVRSHKRDGYLTNGYNDADNQAIRAGLLFKPDEQFSLLLGADYYQDKSKGPGVVYLHPLNTTDRFQTDNPWFGYAPAGCGNPAICPTLADSNNPADRPIPAVASLSVAGADGYVNNTQLILRMEATWQTPLGTLTILPAYVRSKADFVAYTASNRQITDNKVDQTSLEVRLASNGEGPLQWILGGFYFREVQNSLTYFLTTKGYQTISNPNLPNTSYAAFGQGTYSLTDSFRLTAGLRYTHETKEQSGYETQPGITCPAAAIARGATIEPISALTPVGGCRVPNVGSLKFNNVTTRVGLEYDLAPRSLLFVNYATGFKAGGFWSGLAPNVYRPEKLTAYQIGIKNRFFDNRLQLNAEIFYWDYKDQQINVRGTTPEGLPYVRTVNAPGNLYGAEVDGIVLLGKNDQISFDILYSKGKYDLYPLATNSAGVVTSSLTDWPRINMPLWSGTVGYSHTFDLANGGDVELGLSTHFESGTWLSVQHLAGSYREAYHTSDARLTYTAPNRRWSITAYLDNIEDEAVIFTGTSGSIGRGVVYRPANSFSLPAGIGAPRTYGVRLNAKF